MDRSVSRIVAGTNESQLNIRDDVCDDDDEFFNTESAPIAPIGDARDNSNDEVEVAQQCSPDGNFVERNKENDVPVQQAACALSSASSRRHQSNLSRISEAPDDEFSFSFKRGENAVQMLDMDHEEWRRQNHLRLPSISFHASRYSMKHSWEESALRHQNATLPFTHFARSELDISQCQIPSRNSGGGGGSPLSHQDNSPISLPDKPEQREHNSPKSSAPKSAAKPFISSNRFSLYFGFRRLGVDCEETVLVHNIHPERERIQIKCRLKKPTAGARQFFKLLFPPEHGVVLEPEQYLRVAVAFMPEEVIPYENVLLIECKSAHKQVQTFALLLHGFGGRSVVEPVQHDSAMPLPLSANGQYQLVVKSLAKFRFGLKNRGNRGAFATICVQDRNGEPIESQVIVSMRNMLLGKPGGVDDCTKVVVIRYVGNILGEDGQKVAAERQHGSFPPSATQSLSDLHREISLRIVVFWGEERQRQRLKQLENKTGGRITNFGRSFTLANFCGENEVWAQTPQERHISEEEFYCFEADTRITFINVLERTAALAERPPSSMAPVQRTCSAMSLASASSAAQRELRAHQTIVEMDPDNTLVGGAEQLANEDDTLT